MAKRVQSVTIIGAGLSGLTLGLALKSKGIAATVYERHASAPHYNYGITLCRSTYRPLLELLKMDESTFRRQLAVDAHTGGNGNVTGSEDLRCHRGRLEALLRQGQSICWAKALKEVQINPSTSTLSAKFEDGEQHNTTCLVGSDGPHSAVRQSLASDMQPDVLPYIVYNGKRRMPTADYMNHFHQYMQESVVVQTQIDGIRLEVSLADVNADRAEISYVYSRPARPDSDPLFRPKRSAIGASSIPDEFLDELRELPDLDMPFKAVFNPDQVMNDRKLNWLMRCLKPRAERLQTLAEHGVLLIGDAAAAVPILGGQGAQAAVKDGLSLAEFLLSREGLDLRRFVERNFAAWSKASEDSVGAIEELHVAERAYL